MELNAEVNLDLERAIAKIEAQNDELLTLLELAKEKHTRIDPAVQAVGRAGNLRVAEVRQMNADLFEERPDDAERKLRLALDNALRVQMGVMKKLFQLPPREW